MLDFDTAVKFGDEVFASLETLSNMIYPSTASATPSEKPGLPSLLQFRRSLLATHAQRHLVTELAGTGMTQQEATSMVQTGASSGFANIITWLKTNGPTIAQDIAAAIPLLISLITLFGG